MALQSEFVNIRDAMLPPAIRADRLKVTESKNCGATEPLSLAIPKYPADAPDPAYLNACGVRWEHEKDAPAGWELVQALRSSDPRTRGVAAALLARTPDTRIPVQAVRRAAARGREREFGIHEDEIRATTMKAPRGLSIIEDCTRCSLRRSQWFCGLSPEALKELDAASRPSAYPNGALLFVEGQQARGAFVLCNGQAKLTTTSRDGKVLILRIASSGEVLGLSAALSAGNYELSAETSGPCNINFIERRALMAAVERNPEIAVRTALALSTQLQRAYRDVHDLVLSRSSAGKLARLLLSWARKRERSPHGVEIRVAATPTHEEMAQMIGTSRETVTRLLGELKKKEMIELEGSTLLIRNRSALEALAA
ncbi:MAG TPA: Crp/Fnr family transcriptional regulator [Terriglobales bacterium]